MYVLVAKTNNECNIIECELNFAGGLKRIISKLSTISVITNMGKLRTTASIKRVAEKEEKRTENTNGREEKRSKYDILHEIHLIREFVAPGLGESLVLPQHFDASQRGIHKIQAALENPLTPQTPVASVSVDVHSSVLFKFIACNFIIATEVLKYSWRNQSSR